MPTLYAFLTAINNYPNPRHALNGCRNDLQAVREYLQAYFDQDGFTLRLHTLENEQATRENLIRGFDHFRAAENGDTCLFFFAGHGSRWAAPEAFWHIEAGRKNESLVCYDSRTDGVCDLMDKELSYLIWRATKDKDVHFVVITDCCHSGTVTRLMGDVQTRRAPGVDRIIPAEKYLGFEHYKKSGEGRYSPPRGRHVHLAAAQANETAKEVYVKGQPKGIFTYCLLEVLTGARNRLSYAELVNRTAIRLRNAVPEQSPFLTATQTNDQHLFFLSGDIDPGPARYVVGYDKKAGRWMVDAGGLHGLTAGPEASPTRFELSEDNTRITVTEVEANRSLVDGLGGYDKNKTFTATLIQQSTLPFPIAFAPACEMEGQNQLQAYLEQTKADFFHLTGDPQNARYFLHARDNAYYLTTPYDRRPLFRRVPGYGPGSAADFLAKLKLVTQWNRQLERTNPASSIRENEFQIELYRVTEAGNEADDAPVQRLDWRAFNEFPYLYQHDNWFSPAFQLRIRNIGYRTLWFSLLYFDDMFGITNQLLPIQDLEPGQEVWAADEYQGYPYRTIKLNMADTYQDWGLTVVDNYLKIIICTERFDSNHLNQEGLEIERFTSPRREISFRNQIEKIDWATRDLPFRIYRSLRQITFRGEEKVQPIAGIQIEAPTGLTGRLSLNTLDKATGDFSNPPEPELQEGEFFQPFDLGPKASQPGLCVLELFQLQGSHCVNPTQPLQVHIENSQKVIDNVHLFSCDPTTGLFFPLDFTIRGQTILINQLPKAAPSVLGESVKIFLGIVTNF